MTSQEHTPESTLDSQVDIYWLVSNIFAIIHIIEDKFGVEAVERLIAAATAIEESMRKENQDSE